MTQARPDDRLRLLVRASWCAAAVLALYLVTVRTGVGQHLDDLGFEGRKAVRLPVRRAATAAVRVLVPAALVAVPAASVVVGVRRRSAREAALVLGATGATAALTRVLKDVLPRTNLIEGAYATPLNTYPSGHAATILVLALGVLTIRPRRWSGRRAVAWTTAIVVVGLTALMGSGWHRPGDVLAGLLLAAAVFSVGAALVVPSTLPIDGDRPPLARWLAIVVVGSLLPLLVFRYPTVVPHHPLPIFAAALVVTNLCAVVLLCSQVCSVGDRSGAVTDRSM